MHLRILVYQVAFYTLITYFATSMGTLTLAAHQVSCINPCIFWKLNFLVFLHIHEKLWHLYWQLTATQVMIQTFLMCSVWGEPLSQTAQSFMPEFLYGRKRSLAKVSTAHFYLSFQPSSSLKFSCIESMNKWEFGNSMWNSSPSPSLIDKILDIQVLLQNLFPRWFVMCSILNKSYDFEQARMLLKSLVIIGGILGLFLAVVGTSVPLLFPNFFTPDQMIIREVSSCFNFLSTFLFASYSFATANYKWFNCLITYNSRLYWSVMSASVLYKFMLNAVRMDSLFYVNSDDNCLILLDIMCLCPCRCRECWYLTFLHYSWHRAF